MVKMDYNIVLIGFMGAGKSTVSEYLKDTYGMETAEMDQVIAEREGMTISDIFSIHGEEYFRNLETNLLKELQFRKNTVISCGGGAVLREENVVEMKKNGCVVFLTVTPETVYQRVKDSDERPILNGRKNIDYIMELMEKRKEKYEAAADVIVATDNRMIQDICEEIMKKLTEHKTYVI